MINDKDFTPEEFEFFAKKFSEFIREYFEELHKKPPLPNVSPGFLKKRLQENYPEKGGNFNEVLLEIKDKILPGLTHWNHPRFMAYFNSTSTAPGILGEFLSAAFNTNGMLWKTAPAAVELEEITLQWFRQMLGLPKVFFPIVYDTASISSLHALAAAREYRFPGKVRNEGVRSLPKVAIYISEETHSSIRKAVITLGFGLNSLREIKTDKNFAMLPNELEKAITEDETNGITPLAVIATTGTTSTTALDPINEIAEVIAGRKIWLHVDAAYGGSAAIVRSLQKKITNGWETADSIVVNPHKWLFIPIDFSVLFVRNKNILKSAFQFIPEYLKTEKDNEVINYMDYGIQLGRRFRALKFWLTLKYFGREGLSRIILRHISLAKDFAEFIRFGNEFEILAPVNFAVVVFRATPNKIKENKWNEFNRILIEELNNSGKVFLSHTVVKEKFALRISFSGIRTFSEDVEAVKKLLLIKYKFVLENFPGNNVS